MSWVCIGCGQVQASKNTFAPVMNHTHIVREVEAPTAANSLAQLRADVAAKMAADHATAEQIDAATAAIQ